MMGLKGVLLGEIDNQHTALGNCDSNVKDPKSLQMKF